MTVSNPTLAPAPQRHQHTIEEVQSVTIRFAGDSGDGMQLAGTQFTNTSAILGNDISTLPDFPAEIRAPAGTLAGVSGFQVHFASHDIHTPGDKLDTLVAMNPAALKTNLKDLEPGGILIVNSDAFGAGDLHKAGYKANPLEDGSLKGYRSSRFQITKLNREAVAEMKLSPREADRCKNFFALGLVYWLYDRSLEPTLQWIREKFGKNPAVLEANTRTLKAGYNYGETTEACRSTTACAKAEIKPGTLSQDHRQRGPGPGPGRRHAAGQHAACLRQLSDHAGQRHPAPAGRTEALRRPHLPGRGRNRRHRHGHRRRLRRGPRRDRAPAARASASSPKPSAWP